MVFLSKVGEYLVNRWNPANASRIETIAADGVLNVATNWYTDGVMVSNLSQSAVLTRRAYDARRRETSRTDGRGNVTRFVYGPDGWLAAVVECQTNETHYAYDALGRKLAVTNALGGVTEYAYDACGRKTYEGGATYPVSYAYDAYGNRVSMTTYRDEDAAGDTTTWTYDEASGLLTAKTYADGHGPTYTYTADGRLATRTWARGVVTTYAYDGWGNLTNTVYSDGTPSIALAYDAMGRQISATDLFEWDPTERVATRPLYWQHRTSSDNYSLFYTHDGNKNVSEVVFYQRARGIAAHYEYAPFGEVTVQTRGNAWGSNNLSTLNPWRFSSEYADDAMDRVYYNFRHYSPQDARWMSRDPIRTYEGYELYLFNKNNDCVNDFLGLYSILCFAYCEGVIIGVDSDDHDKTIKVDNVFSGNIYANDPTKQHEKSMGPIPIGEYWIGHGYVPDNHRDDALRGGNYTWHKLYGDNGAGGKQYDKVAVKNPHNGEMCYRSGFNLHTGCASDGCVTIRSDVDQNALNYPQSRQYDALENFLNDNSEKRFVNPRKSNDDYLGILLVRKCENDCKEAIDKYGK